LVSGVVASFRSRVTIAGVPNARSGPPLLPAELNGKIAHFSIDTGSCVSLVSERVLVEFQLSSEVLSS